ncbi:hypothetical protein KIPB_013926, partial [Kipferlia bialata]
NQHQCLMWLWLTGDATPIEQKLEVLEQQIVGIRQRQREREREQEREREMAAEAERMIQEREREVVYDGETESEGEGESEVDGESETESETETESDDSDSSDSSSCDEERYIAYTYANTDALVAEQDVEGAAGDAEESSATEVEQADEAIGGAEDPHVDEVEAVVEHAPQHPNSLAARITSHWTKTPQEVVTEMLVYMDAGIGDPAGLDIANPQPLTGRLQALADARDAVDAAQFEALGYGIQHSRHIVFVGLTVTLAARHLPMLKRIRPAVCLVEEAGELREGELLACLPSTLQQLVLIGDEQQLRPKVEYALAKHPSNYGWSMFERLTRMRMPRVQLTTQRRMRGSICKLVNGCFGQGLRTGNPAASIVGAPRTLPKPLFFMHHTHK